MLSTGNQLRAARALAGIDQADLATRAGVHVNTVRAMEGKGEAMLKSALDVVTRVQSALEAAGVEFLNHGQPGVRLKAQP
jgi:transcriptional regulator with XRE-family HTH domain